MTCAGVISAARPYLHGLHHLDPAAAIASGSWNRARILIGSNHDEGALFLAAGWLKLPPPPQGTYFPPSSLVYAFATATKTGNPNGPGLLPWPRYVPRSRQILSLESSGNSVISNFDDAHRCAFWAANPSPGPWTHNPDFGRADT